MNAKLDPEADRDGQRRQLLAAAGAALLERGYLALTEVDIADRAGVCRATFHAHFADKHDCVLAAYNAASAELDTAIATACSAAPAWPHDVVAAVQAVMELFAASPPRASLIALGASRLREGEADQLPSLAAEIAHLLLLAYLDLEQTQNAVSTDSETNGLP